MADLLTPHVNKVLSNFISLLTLFGAPTFLVCTGFHRARTEDNSPASLAKRGLMFLGIDFLVNFARFIIPFIVGIAISGNDSQNHFSALHWMMRGVFLSDILVFTALSYLLFALFFKLHLSPLVIAEISVCMYGIETAFVYTLASKVSLNTNPYLLQLMDNVIYCNADARYTLMGWFLFPAFGYLFGTGLNAAKGIKQNKLWMIVGVTSFCVWLIVCGLTILSGQACLYRLNAAEHANWLDFPCLVAQLSGTFLVLFFCHILHYGTNPDGNTRLDKFVEHLSSRVLYYYIVQWVIIGWIVFISSGVHAWGCRSWNGIITALVTVLIIVLSYFGSNLLCKAVKRLARMISQLRALPCETAPAAESEIPENEAVLHD